MNAFSSQLISMGKKNAQVVVVRGEGQTRTSVTRHLKWNGFAWMGKNADPSAIRRNQVAEQSLAHAQAQVKSKEDALKSLEKNEDATEKQKNLARFAVTQAKTQSQMATRNLAEVQENYPLIAQFSF